MCFRLDSDSHLRITSEDIVCYKIGKKRLLGLVFIPHFMTQFWYLKGIKTRAVELRVKKINDHEYRDFTSHSYLGIEKGYHSYQSLETPLGFLNLFSRDSLHIGLFKIPQRSHYFQNSEGEYVSEQLVFIKTLSKKNLLNNK